MPDKRKPGSTNSAHCTHRGRDYYIGAQDGRAGDAMNRARDHRRHGMRSMCEIHVKRVYDPPADDDGLRVLVDRLWPRGVSRESGRIDRWLKAVAPSNALRMAVHGDPAYPGSDQGWAGFVAAYGAELAAGEAHDAALELIDLARAGPVTLLYAAKSPERNNAEALRDWLAARID